MAGSANNTLSDPKLELERVRIEAEVRKVEARAKVRQVIYGTMIVGVAAAAFPFAQKLAELVFTERIETARLAVEEQRAVQEDERARREFLNSLADEARSQNIETRVILAEFFAHMAVKESERSQWNAFLEFLNSRREEINEERRELTEVVTGAATTAEELLIARARLDQLERMESPDVRQFLPAPASFEDLIAAVSGETGPLRDPRIQEAIRIAFEGSRADLEISRRLLAEAGFPGGFTLEVNRRALPGGSAELEEMSRKLAPIGVELRESSASR